MKISKARRYVGVVAVLALAATACTDDEPSVEPTGTGTGAASDGIFSTYIIEPEHLSVANTNESEGNAVMRSLSKGLVDYDPQTTEPFNQVAASIESDDFTTYTVTLNEGWTFHDGEAVTAQSFVDSWNYNAYAPNGAQVAGFFSAIEGYADVNPAAPEATADDPSPTPPPPTAETMSGLTVVDETTFTVTLSAANPQWTLQLGYLAYHPVPSAFFDDPVTFEEAPIGNGPFMMEGAWNHDVKISVRRYDAYAGTDPALSGGIDFQIFADDNTALNAFRDGTLDIVDQVPPDEIPLVAQEFPEGLEESPQSAFNYLGFPTYIFDQDDEAAIALRRALSLTIDRATNASTVLNDAVDPLDSIIPPVIPGSRAGTEPCQWWTYDPEEAVAQFEAAGGLDYLNSEFPDGLVFWFNSGSVHELWTEAIANSWTQILGIPSDSITFQALEFSEYLPLLDAKGVTGLYRLGWGMDYPSPQNFLEPLYHSGQVPPNGSNNFDFNDPEFDALIAQGNAAATLDEGIPFYQQAEDIICDKLPVTPHHLSKNTFVSSENVSGVYVDAFGDINYTQISVAG